MNTRKYTTLALGASAIVSLLSLREAVASPIRLSGVITQPASGLTRSANRHVARPNMLVYSHYNFPATGNGQQPTQQLIDIAGTLYGTTSVGGTWGNGTVFKIARTLAANTESVVYNFGWATPDGANPVTPINLGQWLYGVTAAGGTIQNSGTFYKMKYLTPLSNYSTPWNFGAVGDGAQPSGPLIQVGPKLWGVTLGGGNGYGTVFRTTLGGAEQVCYTVPSSVGQGPTGSLIHVGSSIYGTAQYDGANLKGSVFKISTACPSTLQAAYSFGGLTGGFTNDGATPTGSLIHIGSWLYGTTRTGGAHTVGAIFRINPSLNSNSEQIIYSFDASGNIGTTPNGPLTYSSSDNTLIGTTEGGGGTTNCSIGPVFGCGTIFKFDLNSGLYTTMYSFQGGGNFDGQNPMTGVFNDPYGGYYGTTPSGGMYGTGTVYALTCPSCQ